MSKPGLRPTSPRGLLALLTAAGFLIFVQAFMIAPVLPRLAEVLGTTTGMVGLAVPAYLVPYGGMTLAWGRCRTGSGAARSSSGPWWRSSC